jgi:hypothetical protein
MVDKNIQYKENSVNGEINLKSWTVDILNGELPMVYLFFIKSTSVGGWSTYTQ